MPLYEDFYVYFYIREDFTPYYVGKGRKDRAFRYHGKHINIPDKTRVLFVKQNLTELQAFILERYYIRWFGRKDNGTGILRNRTNGGQGYSGAIHTKESNLKRSISISKKVKLNIENGKHNTMKREDGSSIASDRVKNGTHPWLKREDGSSVSKKVNRELVKSGKHIFLSLTKGKVSCVDIEGNTLLISKEEYYSQKGLKENWKYVQNRSKIGIERLKLRSKTNVSTL